MSRYVTSLLPILITSILLPAQASAQDDADDILRQYGVYDIVKQYGYSVEDDTYPPAQYYDSEQPTYLQYAPDGGQLSPIIQQWHRPNRPQDTQSFMPPPLHDTQPNQTAPTPAKPQVKAEPKPQPSATKASTAHSVSSPTHTGAFSYRSLLSNYEQKLYDPILKAIQERRVSVNVSGDLSTDIMKRVIEAITNDHPEIFWMSESFSHEKTLYDQQVTNTEIIFGYNQLVYTADQSAQAFASATAQIVANARAAGSALAMEKYVHDYLASQVTYGSNALDQTAYGAIVNHYAVCAGFARAFKTLMDQLGIPCYVVSGMQTTSNGNTEAHAWNLVYINNKCYNVDVTSDLIEIQRGKSTTVQVDYRLFNKTDDEFKKMGYIRKSEYSTSAFHLPNCN